LSDDFDKSEPSERIDFHEAERLSLEYIESTYPKFCNFINKTIHEAIKEGRWEARITWWAPKGQWASHPEQTWPKTGPTYNESSTYFQKLGFDVHHSKPHQRPSTERLWSITISWGRRDGKKYP